MPSRLMTLAVTLVAFTLGMTGPVGAAPATDPGNTVLILEDTVDGGAGSLEAITAMAQGFTVEVVTAAIWGGKTATDFASYRAIILGDPGCGPFTPAPLTAAEANRADWGPEIDGNIIIIGTNPLFHSFSFPGAAKLTDSGIAFAADLADKTGAYITLSCYYALESMVTAVPVLDQFGNFNVFGQNQEVVQIVAAGHPALSGLTDANLSNWGQSTHEVFDSFDASFDSLVIEDASGLPYILARSAFVAVVEPDPAGGSVEVFSGAGDPTNPNPYSLNLQKVTGGGTFVSSCCLTDAPRESAGDGFAPHYYFDPVPLDVGELLAMTDGCENLLPIAGVQGGIGPGEFILDKTQRVDPSVPSEQRDLLYTGVDDTGRKNLRWGFCYVDSNETIIDGVSLFDQDRTKVVEDAVDCAEDETDFRGVMVGVTMDPQNLSLEKGQWVAWDCDRLRGGVRTSRVGLAMNPRYDSTDIGIVTTNNILVADLQIELEFAIENAVIEGDLGYIAQLEAMKAKLKEAKRATKKARRNVKKNPMLVPGEFDMALESYEQFACMALVLPQRVSNEKAVLADLGMSLKFMICDYENHPESRVVTDCPIDPRILNEILDPTGEGLFCPGHTEPTP